MRRCVRTGLSSSVFVIMGVMSGAVQPLRVAAVDNRDYYWLDKMSFSSNNLPSSDRCDGGENKKLKEAATNSFTGTEKQRTYFSDLFIVHVAGFLNESFQHRDGVYSVEDLWYLNELCCIRFQALLFDT